MLFCVFLLLYVGLHFTNNTSRFELNQNLLLMELLVAYLQMMIVIPISLYKSGEASTYVLIFSLICLMSAYFFIKYWVGLLEKILIMVQSMDQHIIISLGTILIIIALWISYNVAIQIMKATRS